MRAGGPPLVSLVAPPSDVTPPSVSLVVAAMFSSDKTLGDTLLCFITGRGSCLLGGGERGGRLVLDSLGPIAGRPASTPSAPGCNGGSLCE